MSSIVLTGGGTAGHCIPHLAIYPYIKEDFDKFYYFGSVDGIERRIASGIFEYIPICTAKLKRQLTFDNLLILPRLIKGVNQAETALKKIKPAVVFSKGGFVSVPVVIAASKLKIPVIAHASDLTAGLANKLVAPKCKLVLTSFEQTAKSFKNGVYTGPPIKRFNLDRKKSLDYFGFDGNKKVLLILGGSSGSLTINNAITDLLPDLLPKYDILHICGDKHISTQQKNIKGYRQVGYVDDMSLCYGACDFAVSRAGAGALFELLANKIPTLFIPLSKKASRGDQIENAEYFYKKNACLVLEENALTKYSLKFRIELLEKQSQKLIDNMNLLDICGGNKKIAQAIKKFV
jgi:UDP-N-acetylglucosamine--N-acetylmuramyl-(pentapeptide) pyrophosphoryl-undecaprenol N-acetylglucosamine transferase